MICTPIWYNVCMTKKGYKHPVDCACGSCLGHPHTEDHKRYMSRILSGRESPVKGRKHPIDCNHCNVIRGNTYGRALRGISTAGLLGDPVLCPSECGEYFWPRAVARHARICDGEPIGSYGPHWNRIRQEVYARDNWTCQSCQLYTTQKHKLVAHHIKHFRIVRKHEMKNLVTLCRPCHRTWHKKGGA